MGKNEVLDGYIRMILNHKYDFIHFLGEGGGGNKSFGKKSYKICHMILFIFHSPAI